MNDSAQNELHHLAKDHLIGVLALGLVIISLFTTIIYINKRQNLTPKAAGNVTLSLVNVSPSSGQVAPGQNITIDVQVNTGGQTLSAADLRVNVPSAFEFVSFTPGTFLDASNAVKSNGNSGFTRTSISAIDINSKAQTPIPYFSNGVANINIGAVCDECFLGTDTTGQGYPNCNTVGSPAQCYPKSGSGQLARLVLKAKSNATAGNYAISFAGATKAAAIEVVNTSNDNVVNQMNSVSVTVTGSTGGTACELYNFDNDGDIDIADIQQVANRFNNSSLYDSQYDFDNDGDIDIADIQQVANSFGTTCN